MIFGSSLKLGRQGFNPKEQGKQSHLSYTAGKLFWIPKTLMQRPTRLLNTNFLLLWQGQLVSLFGSNISSIALVLWIVDSTNSIIFMGALTIIDVIPGLLLGPMAGAIADRYSRKNILILCDVAYGIFSFTMAGLFLSIAGNLMVFLPALVLLRLAMSAIDEFYMPVVFALTPDLVPPDKIGAANSMDYLSYQAATIFGKGIGGPLYRFLGAPAIFLFDGLSFLFSALSENFIESPQKSMAKPRYGKQAMKHILADACTGFSYVWRSKGLRSSFLVFGGVEIALRPVIMLLPFYVKDPRYLGMTDDWFGLFLGGFGLGMLVGYWLTAILQNKTGRYNYFITVALCGTGIGFCGLAVTRNPHVALFLIVGNGVFVGMTSNYFMTKVQAQVPANLRGRVISVSQTLITILSLPFLGIGCIAADLLDNNVILVFLGCGVVAAFIPVWACFQKNYRQFMMSTEIIDHPLSLDLERGILIS